MSTIDIRKAGYSKPTKIIFADRDTPRETVVMATHIEENSESDIKIVDRESPVYIRKKDIDNLIKALQEAKKVWAE